MQQVVNNLINNAAKFTSSGFITFGYEDDEVPGYTRIFVAVSYTHLLSGKPYDNADFDAGAAKAVISEDTARRLFGTSEVVGKTFLLNHSAYIVCGVVRPVSKLAKYAYAQIWIPLSST